MAGLFDTQAEIYAAARPDYPDSLFEFLASVTHHGCVWDVGTGNGQAAIKLAEIFDRVIATDVSSQQLQQAPQRPNIKYAVTSKSITRDELHSVIGPDHSLDLVTVAQALHWFDLDAFYGHVGAMLRRGGDRPGVLAAWCYQLCHVDADVDAVLTEFYAATSPYWAPQRQLVDNGYRTIDFPFEPVAGQASTGPLRFESIKRLNLGQLLAYFRSWSAVQTAMTRGWPYWRSFGRHLRRAGPVILWW
ncbi:hypothetical protein SELMODRAFT_74069 [Selaginella moellendorffii]|uniref:Methyltransferase domain-containing protein n=1 Tax=Selaginella moellendorffii TaxID=88036 RepID=D8QQW7_SELML|nr:hypothetical protein SELMODRAFT_74069 [Selaginella moellendorffii]